MPCWIEKSCDRPGRLSGALPWAFSLQAVLRRQSFLLLYLALKAVYMDKTLCINSAGLLLPRSFFPGVLWPFTIKLAATLSAGWDWPELKQDWMQKGCLYSVNSNVWEYKRTGRRHRKFKEGTLFHLGEGLRELSVKGKRVFICQLARFFLLSSTTKSRRKRAKESFPWAMCRWQQHLVIGSAVTEPWVVSQRMEID